LARLAIISHEGTPGSREFRLGRILDFFGVPWKVVEASKLADMGGSCLEYAVFGSIRAVSTTLKQCQGATPSAFRPAAYYAYADDERDLCTNTIQSLLGEANFSLQGPPAGNLSLKVSDEQTDLVGPMAGLKFSLRLGSQDAVLTGALADGEAMFVTVISAGDAPVFLRHQHNGSPVFLCTSSQMLDIDQPVAQGFYDVKDHFCSVVPLVMFIRFMFSEIAWRPQELGACLIIDDPLLKSKYGFCNFARLRDLMRGHGFTTNIAFIPWNWRRTSPAAGKFFSNESGLFSISIHGCDHTAGEFGATSREVLHTRAQLARSRMLNHQARTGIQHDPIMVFPQGAFSSACPEVLKRNGFLAAVNTETVPVDSQNARTRIRDVWEVAIMTYGNFPIFTRRYAFHGLENFAFDLLLGKPCLIVAHHDSFRDGGAALIELIEKIGSLNCCVQWRPLGQVIRRACRRRGNGVGAEELEMYGNELLIGNSSDQAIEVRIRKRKSEDDLVSEILCDEKPVMWKSEAEHFVFGEHIQSHSEKRFQVIYQEQEQANAGKARRSLRFELAVAVRRVLSEFRDDYLSRSHFLSASADGLKGIFRKAKKLNL
jgi:hypothetical protein